MPVCISIQSSHSVMSDSLRPHGLQHSGLPCPSLATGICSNSCPLSWWCYLIISFSESISLYLWVFNRCCCSFTKSYLTLQDAMDWSMPAHLSFTISQSLSDSRPLSWWYHLISSSAVSSPFVFNLSQHQGLFQWVSSSRAKLLEFQHPSFQWIFKVDFV